MQLKPISSSRSDSHSESRTDRMLDRIKPQPPAPKSPEPPAVDKTQWEHSVDSHKVNTLTVHDVGLIVFNEMQSFTDSDKANDTIAGVREKVAHALINGDSQFGRHRPPTAHPVEPTAEAMKDSHTRKAYDSSLAAAREAYLSPTDPTHGSTNFQFVSTPDRSNMKFKKGNPPEGLPLKTQSGPFNNSYTKGDVPSRRVYVNTYGR